MHLHHQAHKRRFVNAGSIFFAAIRVVRFPQPSCHLCPSAVPNHANGSKKARAFLVLPPCYLLLDGVVVDVALQKVSPIWRMVSRIIQKKSGCELDHASSLHRSRSGEMSPGTHRVLT